MRATRAGDNNQAPESGHTVRNGVPLLDRRRPGSPKPTMELVNRLRDQA